jgi:hypothetical protein
MKKILIFLLTFICLKSFSQSTVLLRGDTIRVYKQGDSSYLKVDSFLFVTKNVVIGKNYLPLKTSVSLYLSDTTKAIRLNKMWSRFNIVTPENGMQIYEDSTDQFLCYQANSWGSCGGISAITADNGLTANTATNVQLGGTLIQNTEINTNAYYLWLNGTNASGQYTFLATSTTGNTAWISSGSGNALLVSVAASGKTGVEVQASDGSLPYYAGLTSSGTNDVIPSITLSRASSGTAAAGIGTSIDWYAQIAENSTRYLTNEIKSKWADPATATRTSQLDITGVNSASTNTLASFKGSGQLQLPLYGSGTFAGTPTYTLQVDASGNIIEGSGGGGSGTINSGTTGKPAYYVGATTLDDFAAIDYATSGTNMLLTTQNTTDVGLNIKGVGSQTANLLNFSSSAGTGDLGSWTKDGYTKTNRLGLPASVSPSYSLDIQDANTGVTSLQISDPGGGQYRLKIREYGTYIDGYSSVMQVYNAYTAGRLNLGGYNVGDQLALFGTYITVKNRFNEAQGADVASAAGAIALGTGGNTFEITGTSAITLISNDLWQNGSIVTLAFTSTATLVDGTANSGTDIGLELTGNTNFIASAGETVTLRLMEIGGTQRWREIGRSVEVGSTSTLQKGFFLESPGSAEAVDMWQTPVAITVTSLKAILRGSSPSVTYNVKFGTDITSATDVFTAAITCTSVTTGCSNNSGFNDATIPAGSFIWIVTTASSGTINSISWTINYTED